MDYNSVKEAVGRISVTMTANRDYLVGLDQLCGDGDLGVTMDTGFAGLVAYLETSEERDLGRLFMRMASTFNEAAPSSLGTILSFGMMGMASSLKGRESADLSEMAAAFQAGVNRIMERAGSKPGERTILDSLDPAAKALQAAAEAGDDASAAFRKAAEAAAAGAEETKRLVPQHGRAAYYGEKVLGHLDGGAEVGRLIFQSIANN